ncbi:helix-turn-helix transcriptional regulator [uncultured Shewanella sp.]|uniref:helix-turn-helix domain-containing protein n=1 Tax=uncultured Shewanella sp. TaxID=173975 RepID=UPI002626BD2A|nr:helix-turn-helix transcriptional regulator [uncultured Shewanella sp.]
MNQAVPKQADPLLTLAEKTAAYLLLEMSNEVNLTQVVSKMATNRNKLSLAFKTHYGATPLNWLKQQRMEKASQLLIHTQQSIADITFAVGYKDSNHFSTAFKQHHGVSPKQYREQYATSKAKNKR